jgi:UDP-N-acetylmuramate--alanine ligase
MQEIFNITMEDLNLKVPGQHNASNAMAALAVAKILKIPRKKAVEALNEFTGTWRRMEYRGDLNGAKIYDDYGHHPTEIKATLAGARELLSKNLVPSSQFPVPKLYCVFQPHQYQRTYKLFDQFIDAFVSADQAIILPIFSVPGREKDSIKEKVNSKMLAKAIMRSKKPGISGKQQAVVYLNSFLKAKNYLKKNLKKGDVAVVMGAGDVYQLTEMILN